MSAKRRPPTRRQARGAVDSGTATRRTDPRAVALRALARIEDDGGFANLVLASELSRVELERRDRAFVTALVDGTTRMRRACDFLVDRFVSRPLDAEVRRVLRLGAFQLAYLGTPAHAAVAATVDVAPRPARGLVNAVLRRVSEHPVDPTAPPNLGGWPDAATRLSYPDWIVARLVAELGVDVALGALEAMNMPAPATVRDDGYVQDAASAAVVGAVGARPGQLIVDVCAAPGGKSTALAGAGARVVALDHSTNRAGLIASNTVRTGTADRVQVVVADGRASPIAAQSADAVLVDAPCSGLGSLRRRADARWRINETDVDVLAELQGRLLTRAAELVRPGGRLVYSVCTLTGAETRRVADTFAREHPEFTSDSMGEPWDPFGAGGRLLPTADGRDGMCCFAFERGPVSPP